MARITIEDCLKHVDNMYELVHLATKRARMIYKGAPPLLKSKNKIIVIALREIAASKVSKTYQGENSSKDDLSSLSN